MKKTPALIIATAWTLAMLGVLLWLLAGCSIPDSGSDAAQTTSAAPTTALEAPVRATEVEIPDIGVKSSLIVTGKQPGGEVAVPDVGQPGQASFYSDAAMPGAPGPALILGHINGRGQDGVFFRLPDLGPGQRIFINRADGSRVEYAVFHREQVSKTAFPWQQVLAPTQGPELRLVTCVGEYDPVAHSYKDNLIVYASKV